MTQHACIRCGFESKCSHGGWADRHPTAAVMLGMPTVLFTLGAIGAYPWVFIPLIAAAALAYVADREWRRRQALAARADWDYRTAARNQQTPAVRDAAEQMRRTAWQPDVWSAEQPLSPQLPHAVRPANPAPWHIVTQWPTRKFGSPS